MDLSGITQEEFDELCQEGMDQVNQLYEKSGKDNNYWKEYDDYFYPDSAKCYSGDDSSDNKLNDDFVDEDKITINRDEWNSLFDKILEQQSNNNQKSKHEDENWSSDTDELFDNVLPKFELLIKDKDNFPF
jgi:hypothetical protein